MKYLNFITETLFSLKITIILLLIFGAVVGVATFIENDFGRESAYAIVYGAKWFEILLTLLVINLIGNIFKYKMWKKEKLPLFLFHFSFLFIFLGAGITRYFGYEGIMHIREGHQESKIYSRDPYLQIDIKKDDKNIHFERLLYLSAVDTKPINVNYFKESFDIDGKELEVQYKKFIKGVNVDIKEDTEGEPTVLMKVAFGMSGETLILKKGSKEKFGEIEIIFGDYKDWKNLDKTKSYLFIFFKDNQFFFISNKDITKMSMATQMTERLKANTIYKLEVRNLYNLNGFNFVVRKELPKAKLVVNPLPRTRKVYQGKNILSALYVDIYYDGEKKEAVLLGRGGGLSGIPTNLTVKDIEISLTWGAKVIDLPFSLYLKDFIVRKYPGSNKPSSYESIVIVKDPINNKEFEYKIYMNHPLSYGGYTFYQMSYDMDEKGTVLSVNHDPGVVPTYIGYTLLFIGLILNLFNPKSRFGRTLRMLSKSNTSKLIVFLILLFSFSKDIYAYPQSELSNQQLNSSNQTSDNTKSNVNLHNFDIKTFQERLIKVASKIHVEHANKFGEVLVQSFDGRIKPFDTLALEVVNKVHGKPTVFGMNHNQVALGLYLMPQFWSYIKWIKVKHPAIKILLGINPDDKYFAFMDAYDKNGKYKLADAVANARRKNPADRNTFDREILKLDERLYIMYSLMNGSMMRIFPKKDDPNHTWYNPKDALKIFPEDQKKELTQILIIYQAGLEKAFKENDWSLADKGILAIKNFQRKYGGDVIPSETKVKAEILYNKLLIFERLTYLYFLVGFLSIGLVFLQIFLPNRDFKLAKILLTVGLAVAFLIHTVGLSLRWYIAEHPPWTDAYESMLFISWAVALSGIVFARKSLFVIVAVGIFAGVFLFSAHLGWLDPQITTVVPVLKSYWLLIHVSVLTASYGFLGLSAILGILTLILFTIKDRRLVGEERVKKIEYSIREALKINELSLIVGLSLIIIGNFLGAIWANESWGRYWGWDPKETWTAVSIAVYAAIVHLKYIKDWYSPFKMAVFSVLGYFSILMTYFGVNYYLSGLHSYAAGDPFPIPVWVYWALGILILLIILAFRNRKLEEN